MGFMFPNDEGGVPKELCPPCFHLNPNMRYLLFKKTESLNQPNHQYTVYSKLKQLKTTNVKKLNLRGQSVSDCIQPGQETAVE